MPHVLNKYTQYACLILGKILINVNDFSVICDKVPQQNGGGAYTSPGHPCSLSDKSVGQGASTDVKIPLASLSLDACTFFLFHVYVVSDQTLI